MELIFQGANGRLKYALILKPGANVETIRLVYRSTEGLSLDAAWKVGNEEKMLTSFTFY